MAGSQLPQWSQAIKKYWAVAKMLQMCPGYIMALLLVRASYCTMLRTRKNEQCTVTEQRQSCLTLTGRDVAV